MKKYTVAEALEILQANKITTHEESIRRWLRKGKIQGIPPASRKEGWLIESEALEHFMHERLPEGKLPAMNTTEVAKEGDREAIRAEMWWEMARKFIFEGYIEPKKSQIQACIEHTGHSKAFEAHVWTIISKHTMGHRKARIPYLLDACLFNGKRIRLDENYESLEEKILYALIEQIRQDKVRE